MGVITYKNIHVLNLPAVPALLRFQHKVNNKFASF